MGYMLMLCECVVCRQLFTCNPDLVPSIRVSWSNGRPLHDPNDNREAVCQSCVEEGNRKRREQGLPEIIVLPGAYEGQEA